MTQAGWYPDPAGQPQTYRFWDGSSWSQETTSDPYAPPPAAQPAPPAQPSPPTPTPPPASSPPQPPPTVLAGGAPPQQPYGQGPTPGYGAPTPPAAGGYGQQPPFGGGYPPAPPSGGSGGSAKTVLLVVAAVLVLVLLSAGGFFAVRALTDDDGDNEAGDTTSATDEATDETGSTDPTDATGSTGPTESTDPTESTTTASPSAQCTGGLPQPSVTPRRNAERIKGGALSIPIPSGYRPEVLFAPAFAWADNFTPLVRTVEENPESQTSWFSIFGVGGLRKANGFDDPAVAAEVVMTCMIESPDQYSDVTGRSDVSSGAITVDGTDAYQLTVEIRVDNDDLETEGDIAQVIVVDMGDPDMYGLYISQVPIGDQELLDLQTSMVDQILVD